MKKTRETSLPVGARPGARLVPVVLRTGLLLVVLASLVFLSGERRSEWGWAYPSYLVERQRYGFVATSSDWREKFDVEQIGAGWYIDNNLPACATSPGGMDRALLIHVRFWQSWPQWEWLESMVNAHPGSLWLVGNEPDCIWQENLLPEDYAHIYDEIYVAIKGWDPTAVVSPGGIVQPTPLRLAWLDRVLQEYAATHAGALMPVDVWNIHNQILQEVRDAWGADIPPGFDQIDKGVLREVQDNDSIEIFIEQIWDFREWMDSRGYGGWPLIITEFGVLMPIEFGFSIDRVNAFMDDTFEFLNETTSLELGDPSDGYRLVQRWAWFSLDNPPYDPDIPMTFNGNLFDPYTTNITAYGLNFATHTTPLPPLDYIDLRPGELRLERLEPVGEGELVTSKVQVEVRNLGNLGSGPFAVSLAYDGPVAGQLQLPVTNLGGGSGIWLEFDLHGLSVGAYNLLVSVDSGESILEPTECDNQLESVMVVPSDVLYFPLILRRY